jgi:hypothetical protein
MEIRIERIALNSSVRKVSAQGFQDHSVYQRIEPDGNIKSIVRFID